MGKMGLLQFGSSHSFIVMETVSHLPRELPLLVAVEIAANGHLRKSVLRLELVPLSCCGNLVTDPWHLPSPHPFSSFSVGVGSQEPEGGVGSRSHSTLARGNWIVPHGGGGRGIYPHTSGNRKVRGLGAGAGRTKGRREGGLGLEKGLTMGQLEGGEDAPRQGASGVPSRAGPP